MASRWAFRPEAWWAAILSNCSKKNGQTIIKSGNQKSMKKSFSILIFCGLLLSAGAQNPAIWTAEKANDWYKHERWIVGCNFIPSTAINELEMWQAATFDESTIQRELGWAHQIGFNTVRVFLHYIPWQTDAKGFKERMHKYLHIADDNQIKTIFVFFDDCWNDDPKAGVQPKPKPGVHNSGWMQCPGKAMHNDSASWKNLEKYVKDILASFRQDKRILMWDLYNEPGNSNYNES